MCTFILISYSAHDKGPNGKIQNAFPLFILRKHSTKPYKIVRLRTKKGREEKKFGEKSEMEKIIFRV